MLKVNLKNTLLSLFALSCITSCSKPQQPVNLPFQLKYQGKSISCQDFAQHQLKDFRLFLHDVELQDSSNQWQSIELEQNQWQHQRTLLLDFEDGSNHCELGTPAINQRLKGTVHQTNYQAIRFTLGVPFDLNHQNPLTAKAPLNDSSMHWHWQAGYKFARIEMNLNGNSHRFHIGSLQCKGEVQAITHCEIPNRATIELSIKDLNNTVIDIDLAAIVDFQSEVEQQKLTCMGKAEHPWCANALAAFGLNQQRKQQLFSSGSANQNIGSTNEN